MDGIEKRERVYFELLRRLARSESYRGDRVSEGETGRPGSR